MNLSQLVTSNGPKESKPIETPPPHRLACNVIPSVSVLKRKYQDVDGPSYSNSRIPQTPLSPPEEGANRCSLPSISNLLEGADSISKNPSKRQQPNPPSERDWDRKSLSNGSNQANRSGFDLPPTPPLRPESGSQERHRSSTSSSTSPHPPISVAHLTAANPSPRSELLDQRRFSTMSYSHHSNRSSLSQASRGSIHDTTYPQATTAGQPPAIYASPVEPPTNPPDYYRHHSQHQQTNYQPPMGMRMGTTMTAATPQLNRHEMAATAVAMASSSWQHHHYFPPSNSTTFPINHDRYICRTCHKAFSRPSSLRIHSHSHTGEKPFRCPHVGCGKAFSVRSNMKRHERGCHTGRAAASAVAG